MTKREISFENTAQVFNKVSVPCKITRAMTRNVKKKGP